MNGCGQRAEEEIAYQSIGSVERTNISVRGHVAGFHLSNSVVCEMAARMCASQRDRNGGCQRRFEVLVIQWATFHKNYYANKPRQSLCIKCAGNLHQKKREPGSKGRKRHEAGLKGRSLL